MVHIGNSWDTVLAQEFRSPYYLKLREFLKQEYYHYRVYPNMYDIFNALKYTPYEEVKAVILGQDPYHGPGQAHGLCFSVREGVEPPPSLKNIYAELQSDLGVPIPRSGELTVWAQRGVLLLNTTLTVREGRPMSHKGQGWEQLTDAIISKLNEREQPIVFILWGSHARTKKQLITNRNHFIIESAHPSPLSAYHGFFGSRPFSRTNEFLKARGIVPINWDLTDT
ncbi:MAG: uracil-DNA glycosylase [Ruminococcus sp.]|nr:uracil-DNA glycosylase [Ruminococcus sp.]